MSKVEQAAFYFEQGFSCAQAKMRIDKQGLLHTQKFWEVCKWT